MDYFSVYDGTEMDASIAQTQAYKHPINVWNNTAAYEEGTIVTISGDTSIYLAPAGGIGINLTPPGNGWVVTTTPEKGGLVYDISKSYISGDIVSYLGDAYIANVSTTGGWVPANWDLVSSPETPERGGLLFDTTVQYQAGDIVSDANGKAFIANATTTGAWTGADWDSISDVTGRVWDSAITYKSGDVVTSTVNRQLYTAQSPIPAGGTDPSSNANWQISVDTTEKGGILWATGTSYVVGDIITVLQIAYICNINHTSSPAFISDIAFWDASKTIERGGRLFNTSLQYLAGDQVTDANGKLFIANKDTTGAWTGADWDYVSDQAGKLWDVSISYKIGDLVTSNTANYPVYVCVVDIVGGMDPSNPASTGEWRLIKSNERGGIAWKTLLFYLVGDIVSENGLTYICIEDHQAGIFQDDFDNITVIPLNSKKWTYAVAERGGIEYNGFTQYKTGDIVSQGRNIWIALSDNLGVTPDGINIEWFLATGDERGGVAWDADNGYIIGDTVSDLGTLYMCILPHGGDPLNGIPSTEPTRWTAISSPAGTTIGDMLIWDGTGWVAKAQIRYSAIGNGLVSVFVPATGLTFTEADVFVNGSLQEPNISYILEDTLIIPFETMVKFTSPPPTGAWIRVNTLA